MDDLPDLDGADRLKAGRRPRASALERLNGLAKYARSAGIPTLAAAAA
jgi:hypothetical protein